MSIAMTVLRWLGKAVEDSKSGLPSVKRVMFAMVVTFLLGSTCGMLITAAWIIWLAKLTDPLDVIKAVLPFVENMSLMLLTAVTTGYIGGKVVEKKPEVTDNA